MQKIFPNSSDVFLITMPFADLVMPSLALGLLKAQLNAYNIKTTSVYGNLLFAEYVGIDSMKKVSLKDQRFPLDEWIFASTAFPEHNTDQELFFNEVYSIGIKRWQTKAEFSAELNFMRVQAEKFCHKFAAKIVQSSPLIVACSSGLSQRVPSLAILRKIRQLNPEIITLVGGGDYTDIMGKTAHRNFSWLDYVVSGEAEDIIVPLVKNIFKYGKDTPQAKLPPGVLGPIHRKSAYPYQIPKIVAQSFNKQKMPCYQEYFQTLEASSQLKAIRPSLPIQASRGCSFGKCKFCALNAYNTPYRIRPAKQVFNELKLLSQKYQVTHFTFLDNMLDPKHFDELLPHLINDATPYTIFFLIAANTTKEQFALLRKAGGYFCQPGIESLNQTALEEMNKAHKVWKAIETLKWARKYAIHLFWIFLHSYPNEQDYWYETISKWIPLLEHLNPPLILGKVDYERGSHYFEHACAYKLNLMPAPAQKYIYPLQPSELQNYLYLFYENNQDSSKQTGLEQLKTKIKIWQRNFKKDAKPSLTMIHQDKEIIILDTRSIAKEKSLSFKGLKKDILLKCVYAQQKTPLKNSFLNQGVTLTEIDSAIAFLQQKNLVLEIAGHFLTLAIEEPLAEYHSIKENPLGSVN